MKEYNLISLKINDSIQTFETDISIDDFKNCVNVLKNANRLYYLNLQIMIENMGYECKFRNACEVIEVLIER